METPDMLLSFTLNTADDSADDARIAIMQIAGLYHIPVSFEVRPPGDTEAHIHVHVDPSSVGFGGTPTAAATLPPPDAETAALLARVEVDHDGLPWDARIHAGTKTKNADGRWKAKKNVDEAVRERVVAELRAIMASVPGAAPPPAPVPAAAPPAPAPAAAPPPAPVPAAAPPAPAPAAAPPPAPVPAAAPPAPAPAAAPPPAPVPAAAPPAPAVPSSFAELAGWMGQYMASRQLTLQSVAEAMAEIGVVDGTGTGSFQLLAMRPDLITNAYNALCARITAAA